MKHQDDEDPRMCGDCVDIWDGLCDWNGSVVTITTIGCEDHMYEDEVEQQE